jgi:hypothetical protein
MIRKTALSVLSIVLVIFFACLTAVRAYDPRNDDSLERSRDAL